MRWCRRRLAAEQESYDKSQHSLWSALTRHRCGVVVEGVWLVHRAGVWGQPERLFRASGLQRKVVGTVNLWCRRQLAAEQESYDESQHSLWSAMTRHRCGVVVEGVWLVHRAGVWGQPERLFRASGLQRKLVGTVNLWCRRQLAAEQESYDKSQHSLWSAMNLHRCGVVVEGVWLVHRAGVWGQPERLFRASGLQRKVVGTVNLWCRRQLAAEQESYDKSQHSLWSAMNLHRCGVVVEGVWLVHRAGVWGQPERLFRASGLQRKVVGTVNLWCRRQLAAEQESYDKSQHSLWSALTRHRCGVVVEGVWLVHRAFDCMPPEDSFSLQGLVSLRRI
ncbi:hypothetical protein Q31a_54730 [Aureliella helgolandensis]|uniref:Uncharacterized protein n=1 Tax=Aureliella helgolandensis TaxID=2527968 RepID=A0A518GER2_9BACT|nr:hypothetical protein Q31a_54730 [Aureliella helgolandensis]